jgi:hypothetical protein
MQSSTQKKPFTFSAPVDRKKVQIQKEKTCLQTIHETFHDKFLVQVGQWKELHDQGVEFIQNFLTGRTLLLNATAGDDLKTMQHLSKCTFMHSVTLVTNTHTIQ